MRIHTDLLPDTLVRHTGLPRPHVEQTLRRAKEAARIGTGRPFAPPLTARDISRILLALSAPSPSRAAEHERTAGRLVAADGQTVEQAIINLLADGRAEGQIAICQSSPFVEIRMDSSAREFGALGEGFAIFVIIPVSAAVAIGCDLINK